MCLTVHARAAHELIRGIRSSHIDHSVLCTDHRAAFRDRLPYTRDEMVLAINFKL